MKKILVVLTAIAFIGVSFTVLTGCSCERSVHIQGKPAITKCCKCSPKCECSPCGCLCNVK